MTPLIDPAWLTELRAFASRTFGLNFGGDKQDFLAEVLRRRIEATDAPSGDDYLRGPLTLPEEQQAISAALTVPETYFFRGADQLKAFQEAVLPDRIRRRRDMRELRILSAGCATGEEPYTLAIILRDSFPELQGWTVSITGFDLVPRNLKIARAARYSTWSLRETPPALRERCFRREGSDYILDPVYRERVVLREVNLHSPPADAFRPATYDVVFCRNVIMYFTPQTMASVVRQLTTALVPGGYLFLGHAEALRDLTSDFVLRHTHETFYYQRRDGASTPDVVVPRSAEPEAVSPPPAAADDAWVDSIRASSERLEQLFQNLDRAPEPAKAEAGVSDLRSALELFRRERFQEALQVVSEPADPDAVLLRAVLLLHCGRPSAAEALCGEILAADDGSAEAHHLLALCREQAGDPAGAVEQNRFAQYLDPEFAMPRFHTGRLLRRRSEPEAARREYSQALPLLAKERPLRILLFGGGFSREALLAHCGTELEACGGGR